MAYTNKTVSLESTEQEFIEKFIESLIASDSRITCDTDIAAQFSDTSNTPTIVLNISDCYTITLTRYSKLISNGNTYKLTATINDVTYGGESISFRSDSKYASDVVTRTFKLAVVSNDNIIAILFGGYDTGMPTEYKVNYISYHADGFNAVAAGTATAAIKGSFIRTDSTNQGEVYTISNRLSYSREGSIEIIESKPLLQGGAAAYDMENIFDCSTVTAGQLLLIESNKYFTIDTHSLIKLGA